jgi:hypothetical protein
MTRASFLAATMVCIAVCGLAPTAMALPKQGAGKCDCACSAPSGAGGHIDSFNTYDPHGLPCDALVGATCNVSDPSTGGVATGTVQHCFKPGDTPRGQIILQNGIKLSPLRLHR